MERVSYELPDGSLLYMDKEVLQITEPLFRPAESDGRLGIADMVHKIISEADTDLRRELYGSIILAGTCSEFTQ